MSNRQAWQGRQTKIAYATKTANYTLAATDDLIVFTAGGKTLDISGVASLPGHPPWTIANESTGNITIDAGASATLKGERYQTLPPGSDIIIRCYATNKFV